MPFTQPRIFLTAPEAAKRLGGRSTGRTVSNLIRSGQLKGKKIANQWRILPEWLDEYMTQPDNVKP
jgi:excisionase family DNA binding protein